MQNKKAPKKVKNLKEEKKSSEIQFSKKFRQQKLNKQMINNNNLISKNDNIFQNKPNFDFSVKLPNAYKGDLEINKILPYATYQHNYNNKILPSGNLANSNSNLFTQASFYSDKSSNSFYINNSETTLINNNIFLQPNINILNIESPINNKINLNNNYINNQSSKLSNSINNSIIINQNKKQNLNLISKNNNNKIFNKNNFSNKQKPNELTGGNTINKINKINKNKNKHLLEYSNSNNINGSSKKNNIINKNNKNLGNHNRQKSNRDFSNNNKINSKEKSNGENTVVLEIVIKVSKNENKIFKLRRYDNLFLKFEKFAESNNISQDLIRPLLSQIFGCLDKIFSVINNKIGNYDKEYLNSLNKLWIKNNKDLSKIKNKKFIDKRTNSSDSSNEKTYKDLKSNSYQNTDGNNNEENLNKRSQSF